MGNVTSVANAFRAIGANVFISNRFDEIETADRIVLPGVGAFGEGVKHLRELNLIKPLEELVLKRKKPFLGICLGMQLLATIGHEFEINQGLNWIPGEVNQLAVGNLRLPHIGWNNFSALPQPSSLLSGIGTDVDFYYVHSYHFVPKDTSTVMATCEYGQTFPAVIAWENIMGVQFHPEKSQKAGEKLLLNFIKS